MKWTVTYKVMIRNLCVNHTKLKINMSIIWDASFILNFSLVQGLSQVLLHLIIHQPLPARNLRLLQRRKTMQSADYRYICSAKIDILIKMYRYLFFFYQILKPFVESKCNIKLTIIEMLFNRLIYRKFLLRIILHNSDKVCIMED